MLKNVFSYTLNFHKFDINSYLCKDIYKTIMNEKEK